MIEAQTLKDQIDIRGHAQRLGLQFDAKKKKAICPAHEDTNPSLSFKGDICKCFSCGWGGDVIELHMKVRGCDFKAAVDELASQYSLGNGQEPPKPRQKQAEPAIPAPKDPDASAQAIYSVFSTVCGAMSDDAIAYLTGPNRGLTRETIDRFGLFTVSDYRTASDAMKRKFTIDELKASGLFNVAGNLVFFKHRIIIPDYSPAGAIVYLRGRYFDHGPDPKEKDVPKMLGLAGVSSMRLWNSRILTDDIDRVMICEGEFDAMVACQAGHPAIALHGMKAWVKNAIDDQGEIIEESWMVKKLKPYRIDICLDNPKPSSPDHERLQEQKQIDNAVAEIVGSFLQVGHSNVHIASIPLKFKDLTDFTISSPPKE